VASTEVESIETPVVGLSSSAAPPQDPTPTIVTTNTTINPPLVCATVAFAESPADSEATFVEFDENGCCVPAGPVGQAKEQAARFLLSSRVEVAISAFVLLNSLLVALATLSGLPANLQWDLRIAEETIGLLLVADFVARWFSSSKETGNHILDVQFAFDVVAIVLPVIFTLTPVAWMESTPVPNWLTEPSALFNLQLLRVFRLQRVLVNLESFAKFERALGFPLQDDPQEWQLQFARVLLSLFTLLSVSTGLIYTAEHEVNPAMGDYFSALYFGMTTLTTVGFGDIAPVTSAGRLVVCGSIVAGVAIVPAQAAALVEAFLARQASRQQPSRRKPIPGDKMAMNSFNSKVLDTAVQCESCGATLHWSDARYCYYCGEDL
jgi:voltage-gated potassium channel